MLKLSMRYMMYDSEERETEMTSWSQHVCLITVVESSTAVINRLLVATSRYT